MGNNLTKNVYLTYVYSKTVLFKGFPMMYWSVSESGAFSSYSGPKECKRLSHDGASKMKMAASRPSIPLKSTQLSSVHHPIVVLNMCYEGKGAKVLYCA
jgi:hypothetical protein